MGHNRDSKTQAARWALLGKQVCDVAQMLEYSARMANHSQKPAETVIEATHSTMKTAAHLLRHVLEELNREELYYGYEAK
ncbi:MAG: hypothetical protein ACRD72_00760 [Candidatus Angelobacter sp.]